MRARYHGERGTTNLPLEWALDGRGASGLNSAPIKTGRLPVLDRSSPLAGGAGIAMLAEHANQRSRLAESLKSLENLRFHPKVLAQNIIELIGWIESDMASEEEAVLEFLPHSGQEFD